MAQTPLRVFFGNWMDADNYNAQSLNVREIALRLDAARFRSVLFYERCPDARFLNDERFRLIQIPPRFGTATMLREAYRGHDIFFRANPGNFTKVWQRSPRFLRGEGQMVHWLEEPAKPFLLFESPERERDYVEIQARVARRYAVSEFVAGSHKQAYGLSCDGIIPVGVDTARFFSPPRPARAAPMVLFVGHLMRRKAPHAVLYAARKFPHVRFVLVGGKRDGFYDLIRRTAEHWSLENVTFLEPMPQAELLTVMREADILLHPSQVEGLPKVVIEAAATGLPAIVWNTYRAPAVADGVTGFQVASLGEMLARLERLTRDAELRREMGRAAAEHVKQFDWAIVVKEWERVFMEMAERR